MFPSSDIERKGLKAVGKAPFRLSASNNLQEDTKVRLDYSTSRYMRKFRFQIEHVRLLVVILVTPVNMQTKVAPIPDP